MKTAISISILSFFISSSLMATDYFWVGNSGNWSDYGNHWATSSGGSSFHAAVPGSQDDVHFDQNSFSQTNETISIDIDGVCNHLIFTTSMQANIDGQKKLTLYGKLKLTDVQVNLPLGFHFESLDSIQTIDLGSQTLQTELHLKGSGSTSYYLQQKATLNGGTFIDNCRFYTLSHDLKTNFIIGFSTANLYLGNSILDLSASGDMSNVIVHGGTSHIFASDLRGCNGAFHDISIHPGNRGEIITQSTNASFENIFVESTSQFYFNSGTLDVNRNLTVLEGGLDLATGIQNINSIKMLGQSESMVIHEGDAFTEHNLAGHLYVNSHPGSIAKIESESSGKQGVLNTSLNDSICYNYLSAKDIKIDGASTYIADNSSDLGNTQGIIFGACQGIHALRLSDASAATVAESKVGDTISDRLTIEAFHPAGKGILVNKYKVPNRGTLIDHNNGSYSYIRHSLGADTLSMAVDYQFGARAVSDTVHWIINDSISTSLQPMLDVKSNAVVAYPNPFSNVVTLMHLVPDARILVLNSQGLNVLEKRSYQETQSLDLSMFSDGIYIVLIQGKKTNQSLKLLKH